MPSNRDKIALELIGVKELEEIFKLIPKKAQERIIRRAYRRSAKLLVKQARAEAPKSTGNLAKSIGASNLSRNKAKALGVKTNLKTAIVVAPRTGKSRRNDGWYAPFVEFSTTRKYGKGGKAIRGRDKVSLASKSIVVKAQPFMKPAARKTQPQITKNIGTEMRIAVVDVARRNTLKLKRLQT